MLRAISVKSASACLMLRRLLITRWLGRAIRPSFLVSRCGNREAGQDGS